jgi:3-oxoacyl-[acyl-carrier protein] reductase
MVNMSSSLAKTLAHNGITVNTVSPGTILTPAVESTFRAWAKQLGWGEDWDDIERRFVNEKIPIAADHFGRPEDIGRMVRCWRARCRAIRLVQTIESTGASAGR